MESGRGIILLYEILAAPDQRAINARRYQATGQGHRQFEFGAQQFQHVAHALLGLQKGIGGYARLKGSVTAPW